MLSFADLLRQLRIEVRLTQEELAEAAGLSPRSISDLERGINRTARKDSALLLADALRLTGQVRDVFVAAARGRAPAADVLAAESAAEARGAAAATRTLPRDIGSFTGREPELRRLLGELSDQAGRAGLVAIHAIDGMAGIGKTTFAVHAAHELANRFPDGQFFLPLHAHTPGQVPVTPEDALASLLMTAGVAAHSIPPGLTARANRWRDEVAGKRILLLLDDAAGHEQVRPLLPATAGSLVIVTSRRRLTALDDAEVISLDTLSPAEAAALLTRLAGRGDLEPGSGPVAEITRMCGYLPLAVGMLARQLRHHPARSAAELAADLAAARDRLAVMRAENLSVAAAFDLSYADLGADLQRLLRRIGPAPSADVDAYAAAALDDTSVGVARSRLDELYDHHLISEPAPGRYLIHDLLREYARSLADGADSRDASARLVNYYAHVAAAASKHIATWTTAGGRLPPSNPPADAPEVSDPEQASAWFESERANLHTAVGYAADVMPAHSVAIASAMGGFLRARGHWDQAASQYRTAVRAAREAGDRPGEAGALDELGLLQQLAGDYSGATATLVQAQALYHNIGDRSGQAYALNHLGLTQQETADFAAALASHQQALALAIEAGDQLAEAVSLTDLAMAQLNTGAFEDSAAGYERALVLIRAVGSPFDEADIICEIGWLQQETGDYTAALASSQKALQMFRQLGDRLGQSWALSHLGSAQLMMGEYRAAATSFAAALEIQNDLGSRFELGWTFISLGELALRTSQTQIARDRFQEALAIARELGGRLQEARAVEGIGQVALKEANVAEAAAHFREALAMYERTGSPGADRIRAKLTELDL